MCFFNADEIILSEEIKPPLAERLKNQLERGQEIPCTRSDVIQWSKEIKITTVKCNNCGKIRVIKTYY